MTTAATDELDVELPPEFLEQVWKLSALQLKALRALLEAEAAAPTASAGLKAMLTQRWDDYQSGKTTAIPLDEHLAEIERRIAQRSGT